MTPAPAIDLDKPMTKEEFATWLGVTLDWVEKRVHTLPGVIVESRQTIRIHPRTYLAKRVKGAALK